jgi:hypothetical protein
MLVFVQFTQQKDTVVFVILSFGPKAIYNPLPSVYISTPTPK